ncbi:hypothetical protein PRUPE_3G265500 [Prunus persica]|uniref:Uncharacterized protein n=1 Tax=Prunus persica TaxID=3760 RepID=M5WT56_PRUPE|nr:hypothetical protein PRUPE_3G265500 [Prunus persica]
MGMMLPYCILFVMALDGLSFYFLFFFCFGLGWGLEEVGARFAGCVYVGAKASYAFNQMDKFHGQGVLI